MYNMKNIYKLLLIILVATALVIWYNQIMIDKVQRDIDQSAILIEKRTKEIEKALIEKTRAERLLKLSQDYKKWLSELDTTPSDTKYPLEWTGTQLQATSTIDKHPTNIACLEWTTINISEWYREDFIEIKDCWAFSDYWIKWCYQDSKHIPCLLNNDLTELNKLMWL